MTDIRHIGQWNWIESSEINPYIFYGQLIFYKDAKTIQQQKIVFQQMVLEQLSIHMQKNEVEPLPHIIYKNQLKMEFRPKYKR